VLVGAALFLVLLVGLLAIPITLDFDFAWRQSLEQNVRLRWAFGLVRVRIPSSDLQAEPESPTAPKETAPTKKKRRARQSVRGPRNVLAAVRDGRFRRRILKFAGDLWGAVRKRSILLRLRIGLGDPADTVRVWAVVGPIAGMLSAVRDATIQIEPEFFDPAFELDTSGSIRVVPLHIVYLVVGLIFSPSIWRGVRIMRNDGTP
jgi:hypothetical protein